MNRPVLRATLIRAAAAVFAVAAAGVRAEDQSFDFKLSAGLNYETAEITPSVKGTWPEGAYQQYFWRDVSGESGAGDRLGLKVSYESFAERTAGRSLPVDGYVMSSNGAVTNAAVHKLLLMGKVHDDNWMDEDAASFLGTREGTGTWSGGDMARVDDGMIVIDTSEMHGGTEPVMCTFETVPKPRRGYTFATQIVCNDPSYELADPTGRPIGLTIAAPNEGETSADAKFYFVDNGAWRAVSQAVCNPTVTNLWELHIAVDGSNALARASYYVRAGGEGPWTILGTGRAPNALDATRVGVWGKCSVSGYRGNGFDTQLVQLIVTFDGKSLYPGRDFAETIVTGRVHAVTVHETDRLEGTCTVTLYGSDGSEVAADDFEYVVDGDDLEFYVPAANLNAGCVYTAVVTFGNAGDAGGYSARQTAVMGRPVTNDTWGTDWIWVHETARTYAGQDPGTGTWTGRSLATTNEGWIVIDTESDESLSSAEQVVSFTPTNALGAVASYVAKIHAVFNDANSDPEGEDAVFGLTVGDVGSGENQFLCLSNRVWQAVPTSVIRPVFGRDYELTVYVEEDVGATAGKVGRLTYTVVDDEGTEITLLTVDLLETYRRLFTSLDFSGSGSLTNLTACGYSTELVRLTVDFSSDTLYPGTNFEATTASGYVHFQQLWETDHTHGQIRVVIRDKWGDVIGTRRISFNDLSGCGFDYYVKGLTPGESYSVTVSADLDGLEVADTTGKDGVMARIVSNELWAVQGEWIREDVDTFARRRLGTGDWAYPPGAAEASGEYIAIDTTELSDETANVAFAATNDLPEHTGYEYRSKMSFDSVCLDAPQTTGRFGLTILSTTTDTGEEAYRFLALTNGVWMTVDTDVYEPKPGIEYAVRVNVDDKKGRANYFVRAIGEANADAYETLLVSFPLADAAADAPTRARFYGAGRVRTLEGDGHDVSIVKIDVDFNEDLLEPGTNFASFVAGGTIHLKQIWPTDKEDGTFTVVVRDAKGKEVFRKVLTYHELVDHDFSIPVEGLEAGVAYDVEVVATLEDDEIGAVRSVTPMARSLGTWIDEDSDTFQGLRVGTGLWSGTNGTASVYDTGAGEVIHVSSPAGESNVEYEPTNDTLSVRCSTLREVRMRLSFNDAGWYSSDAAPPDVPENARAGVTVWADDGADQVALAAIVLTNDVYRWQVLENTRTSRDLATPCDVHFLIDYRSGYVRYELVTDAKTNRVCQFDFPPPGREETKMTFLGDGYVWSVDGDAWDPNLITTATNEFCDLNEAIRGTNPDETLSPLWRADQTVTVDRGTFRVYDPDNWLSVHFPRWYYVVITPDGEHAKIYVFNQSNNWIDYARDGDENVETNGTLFLVKTPEGLSWIAARATNEWISGRIELANDIDLSLHNWTPIAGFSGTFDGCGRKIRRLNNSYHFPEAPGGEYLYGPTNQWGRSTYGLFGTATNATLTGVTFTDVEITNLADSVAVLAGALAGNCAVSNVTVESGTVRGLGGTVAGVAGYADFADFLIAVGNTNRADVAADNELYGDPRYAAGILCVAGPTDPSAPNGTVIVTNNVNAGTVSGIIYDTVGLLGGNIAQILAGTTVGARFGAVALSNNVANGSVDATLIRSYDNVLALTEFPAVNLAPAIWGLDADDVFHLALDANEPGSVPVDPVRRTARMLTGIHYDGAVNESGVLNDRITASEAGALVTMTNSVTSWGPVVLDRDLTFDLGNFTLNALWVHNPFVISNGVTATVRNGTVIVGPPDEGEPVVEVFSGDTNRLTTVNLTIEEEEEDFYRRTCVSLNPDGSDPFSLLYKNEFASILNSSETYIGLYSDSDVTIDVDEGTVKVAGHVVAQLSDCYGFKTVTDAQGNTIGFEVRIADSAAPQTLDFAVSGDPEGEVSVTVSNAKAGFYYAIQHRSSLAEDWSTPASGDWQQATGTTVPLSVQKNGSQGFYRIIMTDHPTTP